MKGKRYSVKHLNKSFKKSSMLFINLLLILFLSMMIISGIKIFRWVKENKLSKDRMNSIKDNIKIDNEIDSIQKYEIDFKALKQINQETVAWIKVNGTSIEYPIVKNSDNNFYLTHSFDKTYNSAGWIFMDCNNKMDGNDKNIVVYGHNRRDGSLFGSLKNILNKEWYNNSENLTIPFITENEKSEYKVFSIYKIENEDYYISSNFSADIEYQKFIDTLKSRSINDFQIDVTTNDHILTLSTCADNNRYRVVLHAVKK